MVVVVISKMAPLAPEPQVIVRAVLRNMVQVRRSANDDYDSMLAKVERRSHPFSAAPDEFDRLALIDAMELAADSITPGAVSYAAFLAFVLRTCLDPGADLRPVLRIACEVFGADGHQVTPPSL